MTDAETTNVEQTEDGPTVGEVGELLADRRWRQLADRLGFEIVGARVPEDAFDAWGIPEGTAEAFDALEVLAAGTGYRLVLAEGVEHYSELRRAILGVHRANPSECVVWWLAGEGVVTVAAAAPGEEGRPFVRRMEIDPDDPDPVSLRQWVELEVDDLADADLPDLGRAYARHVHDVLRQEAVTREFFDRFRSALEELTEEIEEGPDEEQARHDVALATLLRLVFLYFLQERGALDGDRRFVVRRYREAVADGESFYRETLRPLFFGALNRTPERRSGRASELGRLPFLNGGLFEPIPAEREHPDLTWANGCWSKVVGELLERFQFAVDEGVGPDENRAVDPEMLGKVFEGLMYGERRHESGSFYTPRDVVRRVVSDAVVSYADETTDLAGARVRAVLEGEAPALEEGERQQLRELLDSFHLLDPAVGTGAFLLEALRALERLYGACESVDSGGRPYERRRRIVHEHLFGVDVQTTAVRICELRIWLALLSVMPADWGIDEIPPLPNLSHRIACGNSLMAPRDRVRVGAAIPPAPGGEFSSVDQLHERHRDEMADIEEDYLEAHGERKAELRRRLEQLERGLQTDLLEARMATLEAKRAPYDKLESSENLFGDAVELEEPQRREKEKLDEELEALRGALEDVEQERAHPGGFSYVARFGASVGSEGFDVIVTNPPWVRANRLERSRRQNLKQRFRCFSNELWRDADEMGISVPFGAQVDLAALFTERCLELLRPGGHLGALLPSKLFRSLHGSGLRGLLGRHRIEAICDYSDGEREMFDATVYPATLQVQKAPRSGRNPRRRRTRRRPRAQQGTPLEMTVWSGPERRTWSTAPDELAAVGDDVREPWLFAPPEIQELFGRMWDGASPLGSVAELQPRRGMMTGCNRVFVRDSEAVHGLVGDDADEWSRPTMSGRDIRAWDVDADQRVLWAYDAEMNPRADLPGALRRYFEEHAGALEGRADHRANGPLWQLFRLKEGLTDPKVVWRDLAPRLEAAPAGPEIVPLNTVYFIPFESDRAARAVAGLFNSEPLRAFAYALGERARGGWRRHFCWVMRMLPIPDAFVDAVLRDGGSAVPEAVAGEHRADCEAWAGEQFGLDEGAVRRLEEWRCGETGTHRREAA